MANASLKTTMAWNDLNWNKIQRKVFKLQKRIFQAVKQGQKAKARKLQKLLLKSYYAKLLSVRRVTQDNQGKKTAGIDGKKVIFDYQRSQMSKELELKGYKAKSLRRVWIPKPGRNEKRPLGIPTIKDRAMQALVKISLEPYWEAWFEGTSYGFRPGRSAHDAIGRVFSAIKLQDKYILDADIAQCFDKINHDYLLSKLDCPSSMKRVIKQWLKAEVLDNGVLERSDSGTPQGGVISPLLANIALDGMIKDVRNQFPNSITRNGKSIRNYKPIIVRYADDFIVIHSELEVILQCQELILEWLQKAGLKLKPEKTSIRHTLNDIIIEGETIKAGFDFLGFNIRQYRVGKHHSGKTGGKNSQLIGFKTIIKPSKKSIKAHHETIKNVIKTHRTAPQSALIVKLNPIIRGWCNYYSCVCSKEVFSNEDNVLWNMLRAWTVSRTGKASYDKLRKYFSSGKYGNWTFQINDYVLLKHAATEIIRHILVKPEASPYDGNWTYWSTRREKYPDTSTKVAKLLKKQQGKCNLCKLHFHPDDIVETDHIIPKAKGGKDEYKNLQLLHRHCHDLKSRYDGSHTVPMTKD